MTQAVFGNGGYAVGRSAQAVDDPVEKALALLGVHQTEIIKTVSQESRRTDRSAGLSTLKQKVDPTGAALGVSGAATAAGAGIWGTNSRRRVATQALAARKQSAAARAASAKRDAQFAARNAPDTPPRARGGHTVHANAAHEQSMRYRNAAAASHHASLATLKRNKIGRAVTAAGVAGLAGTAAVLERRARPGAQKPAAPKQPAGPSLVELARRQRVEQARVEADRYRSM